MKRLLLVIGFAGVFTGAAFAQSSMPMGQSMQNMPGMENGQMNMNGSMLSASDPADGATLAHAPRTVTLTFMHPVILQTVVVMGPADAPVSATFRRPSAPVAQYGIALPALAAGAYTVNWTAAGMGHTMQGALHFTVQ